MIVFDHHTYPLLIPNNIHNIFPLHLYDYYLNLEIH